MLHRNTSRRRHMYKQGKTFTWKKLNSLYPKEFCTMFGWNWPGGSGEKVDNLFLLYGYHLYLQLTKKWLFILTIWNLFHWRMVEIEAVIMREILCKKIWIVTWSDLQTYKETDRLWITGFDWLYLICFAFLPQEEKKKRFFLQIK